MWATKICCWSCQGWMKALQYYLKGRRVATEKADCKSSKCFLGLALQHAVGHCCQLRGGPSLLSWAAFCPSHAALASSRRGKICAAALAFPLCVSPSVCLQRLLWAQGGVCRGTWPCLSAEALLLTQSLSPECQ